MLFWEIIDLYCEKQLHSLWAKCRVSVGGSDVLRGLNFTTEVPLKSDKV
jgi:hypothetical protein